ncbi:MAG: GIY-YIG nuclease family protein [Planctomycetota bacterium]
MTSSTAIVHWLVIGVTLVVSCDAGSLNADWDLIVAFQASSDGFSTDEVLIQEELRARFLDQLSGQIGAPLSTDQQREAVAGLIKLRKAGKLAMRATQRAPRVDDQYLAIAEIAARTVTNRHRVTTDQVLIDPELRDQLQREAERIKPDVDADTIRRLVLRLRKTRRLKPELVLKVADWPRDLLTFTLDQLRQPGGLDQVPVLPGVYLFRSSAGYLYIGEASQLRSRLTQHLKGSHNSGLAAAISPEAGQTLTVEIHAFPKDSPAKSVSVRRAYESELIRSRRPKFNVLP